MIKKFFYAGMTALALFAMVACDKNKPDTPDVPEEEEEELDPELPAKLFLRSEYMDHYYYWNEQVKSRNAQLDPKVYTLEKFFTKMLHARDRWSWMCTGEEYISSETGVMQGTWGVSLSQASDYYDDYSIRVAYIYPGSPFEQFGVTRGACMIAIGGKDIEDRADSRFDSKKLEAFNTEYAKSENSFTFRLANGRDTTFTAKRAASLNTRSYLAIKVFQPGDFPGLTEPVGYFNYESFLYNFIEDIDNAMATFSKAGCKTLIIDLRYNGGGDSRVSDRLMSYLAPPEAVGKPYVVRMHNNELSSLNETTNVASNPNWFPTEKIYFITGKGSASASEMVMNGLKPYRKDKMQMVGGQTYGKPNGMYVLMYPGTDADYNRYNNGDYKRLKYVFLPICFYNANSEGGFIPDEGFTPNNEQPDDIYHDFGVEEARIKACLTHLVSGVYPDPPKAASSSAGTRSSVTSCALIDDPVRTDPHYGTYKVPLPR